VDRLVLRARAARGVSCHAAAELRAGRAGGRAGGPHHNATRAVPDDRADLEVLHVVHHELAPPRAAERGGRLLNPLAVDLEALVRVHAALRPAPHTEHTVRGARAIGDVAARAAAPTGCTSG